MTGNNGRIDLLGKPRAEAAYTKTAFEQAKGPFMAVKPVYQKEKLQLTGWALTKALESWSWRGCDGEKTEVEVLPEQQRWNFGSTEKAQAGKR